MLFHSSFESSVGPMPSEPAPAGAGIKSSEKNLEAKKTPTITKNHGPLMKIAGFWTRVVNLHTLRRRIPKPLNPGLGTRNQHNVTQTQGEGQSGATAF